MTTEDENRLMGEVAADMERLRDKLNEARGMKTRRSAAHVRASDAAANA